MTALADVVEVRALIRVSAAVIAADVLAVCGVAQTAGVPTLRR
jgi:hypothetical protein